MPHDNGDMEYEQCVGRKHVLGVIAYYRMIRIAAMLNITPIGVIAESACPPIFLETLRSTNAMQGEHNHKELY
jgi:hypothetical protein